MTAEIQILLVALFRSAEQIADAGFGEDVAGRLWIRFQFGAQALYQPAHKLAVAFSGITPDELDDVLDRDDLPRVGHQGVEQAELELGQASGFTALNLDSTR